jgi:hypothetical protein
VDGGSMTSEGPNRSTAIACRAAKEGVPDVCREAVPSPGCGAHFGSEGSNLRRSEGYLGPGERRRVR